MKKLILILSITFTALILFNSCKKDDDNDNNNNNSNPAGNLQMHFSMYGSKSGGSKDTNACDIIDIKNTVLSISVSTEAVDTGQPDDMNWTTIYSASSPLFFTERTPPVVSLPVGTYKSIKIVQKNTVIWKCVHDSTTYEFTDYNNSSLGPDDIVPTNYFYNGGGYFLDTLGHFQYGNAESVGSFQITENATTTLNWRINLIHLDWIDVNSNGTWETGTDHLDNWQTPPGITTMFDFIVTY